MPASLHEFAYDLARSGVSEQERRLGDTRTRTNILLGVGGVVGAVLVKASDGLDYLGSFALASYLLALFLGLYVLLPHTLILDYRASEAVSWARAENADLPRTQAALAGWLEDAYSENSVRLDAIRHAFLYGCVLVAVETVCWTFSASGVG